MTHIEEDGSERDSVERPERSLGLGHDGCRTRSTVKTRSSTPAVAFCAMSAHLYINANSPNDPPGTAVCTFLPHLLSISSCASLIVTALPSPAFFT